MKKPTIYVVCGPTATGKSDYAVELALKVNGEVISADSRQIYCGMDLGTGKITPSEMREIPHHLIDIRDPNQDFSVEEFQKLCFEKIEEIFARGKTPIICGGTGFFIQSVVDNIIFPVAPANSELRAELETKSLEELQEILKTIPMEDGAKVDIENKRRVIRAIELGKVLGTIPAVKYGEQKYNFEMIGLDKSDEELKERIARRLETRLKAGMIDEVKNLNLYGSNHTHPKSTHVREFRINRNKSDNPDTGVSWERLENFGLEYKYIAEFLQNKITETEMIELIQLKSWQYAKRQRTWFRRDKKIKWV